MKKFQFRLQSLENIKGMELETLQQHYAAAQAELRRSEQELVDTQDALEEIYNELADLRRHRADAMILLSQESYAGLLRKQITAISERISKQKKDLAKARELLAEKHKEKKVLEKFHERQSAQYMDYVDRETQKELDEIALSMFQHKSPGH